MNGIGRALSRAAGIAVGVFLAVPLAAFEWPVAPVSPTVLFGQRDGGVMSRGLAFTDADTVRAAGNGKILITLDKNKNLSGFPSTLGNAVIMVHDEGLATVYGNLATTDRMAIEGDIESQTILAPSGSGAWGKESEVRFEVLDLANKTVLNPLLLLPAMKDTKGPRIRNAVAISESGQTFTLGVTKYVKQGQYRLYADVSDTLETGTREYAPFRITVLVNGKEQLAMPFEIMKTESGAVFLSKPDFTYNRLYADPERIFLGSIAFIRGKTDISFLARDFAGNERSAQFSLIIE